MGLYLLSRTSFDVQCKNCPQGQVISSEAISRALFDPCGLVTDYLTLYVSSQVRVTLIDLDSLFVPEQYRLVLCCCIDSLLSVV